MKNGKRRIVKEWTDEKIDEVLLELFYLKKKSLVAEFASFILKVRMPY